MGTELTQKARRRAIDRAATRNITADEPKVTELAGEDDVKNLEGRRGTAPSGNEFNLVMREYYERKPTDSDEDHKTRSARVRALRTLMGE